MEIVVVAAFAACVAGVLPAATITDSGSNDNSPWPQRRDLDLVLLEKCRQVASEEIANFGKLNIRGWILGQNIRIERIVPLFGKHGRHAFAPDLLRCR
jgi:hypothetical protein